MGFRTVVVLYNDQAHAWENDAQLGKKIAVAMNSPSDMGDLHYGKVVECCHADQLTLAVLDSYSFTPIAYDHWHRGEEAEATQLKLIKEAARKLGYRLVKEKP